MGVCVCTSVSVICDLISMLEAPLGCSVGSGMGNQGGTVGSWPEMIVEMPGPLRAFRR